MTEPITSPATPHVKTVACVGGISLERGVPTEEVSEYIREAGNLVWMDVQDPGPEELSMLLEEFGFHPLALEDVTKGQQRPKVDEYKGYLFAVTYCVAPGAALPDLRTVEVDLFIGRNDFLVQLQDQRSLFFSLLFFSVYPGLLCCGLCEQQRAFSAVKVRRDKECEGTGELCR